MGANYVLKVEPAESLLDSFGIARRINYERRSPLFTAIGHDEADIVHHSDNENGHRDATVRIGNDTFAVRTHRTFLSTSESTRSRVQHITPRPKPAGVASRHRVKRGNFYFFL